MYRLENGGILLPEPSRACRDVSQASRGHQTAARIIPTARAVAGQQVRSESGAEDGVICGFACQPDVVDIEEQLPPVHYVGLDGTPKRKIFDFRITYRDGFRLAVEVKPAAIAVRKRTLDELRCVAKAMPRGFADAVALVTENDIDQTMRHNGGVMLRYVRETDAEADRKACDLVDSLAGTVAIDDLVRSLGLGHRGFGALVRLIWRRRLLLTQRERITYRALVKPAEAAR